MVIWLDVGQYLDSYIILDNRLIRGKFHLFIQTRILESGDKLELNFFANETSKLGISLTIKKFFP